MSISVTVNGQSAVDVTASSGDSVAVSVGLAAELVAVTVSPSGAPGPTGPQGPQGSPATAIEVGTVTTGEPGTDVTVTATPSNSGNTVTLDFEIPRGDVGADALWNFRGAYSGGESYAVGDVATHNGETWYRLNANGGNTGDTPAEGTFWTKLAAKGNDGSGGGGGAVSSVAGRTGAVVLAAADVSGLATIATSGSASDLASGTVPAARLPAATTKALGAVQVGSGLSITSGVLSATAGGVSWTTAPASSSASGTTGQFAQDSTYLYACYATDTWLRVQRAAWIVAPGSPTITSTSGDHSSPAYVAVNWSAPANNGGELTGYLVQLDGGEPVSVGASTTTYTFSGVTFSSSQCNSYSVSVKAANSAGQSTAATTTIMLPQTIVPTVHSVTKTPNQMAPGVQYGVYWFPPCMTSPWNSYEVQSRLYYNGAEVVVTGDEDGWESFYSGGNTSHTADISSASSSQQYQFRVRAKNVSGATVLATSGWSPSATS